MADLRHTLARPGTLMSSFGSRIRREVAFSDRPALVGLVAFALGVTVLGITQPGVVPYTALLLPMFLGSLWVWPKSLPWFVVLCLACVVILVVVQPVVSWRTVLQITVTFAIGFIILITAFRRTSLGVSGPRGESMLVDLRDRIHKQGELPTLPEPWDVTSALRTAGGTQFAGDFVVGSLDRDRKTIEVVVVDVSGKGVEAGTRALLLSGAFGGLASAVPEEDFLVKANEYLLKQNWGEGFATAIHLHLCLETGQFTLRKAGHPPAVWLHAGSGTWTVLDSEGPILGLLPGVEFETVTGELQPGDALMLYTDGLVESSDRDLSSGIDRLAGRGVALFQNGFDNAATRMVRDLSTAKDDGALVLVHRR